MFTSGYMRAQNIVSIDGGTEVWSVGPSIIHRVSTSGKMEEVKETKIGRLRECCSQYQPVAQRGEGEGDIINVWPLTANDSLQSLIICHRG